MESKSLNDQGTASNETRASSGANVALQALPALLAGVLLAATIGKSSLSTEEAATWSAARLPIGALLSSLRRVDAVYGLDYLVMHVWLFAGSSLVWMRLLSAIAVVAAVVITTRLGVRLFGLAGGITAGVALALSPLAIRFGTFIRGYALALMLAALSTALLVRALPRGRWKDWTSYSAVSILLLYMQLMGILVLVAQLVAVLLAHEDFAPRARRRMLWSLASAAVAAAPLAALGAHQIGQLRWIKFEGVHALVSAVAALSGSMVVAIALVGVALYLVRSVIAERASDFGVVLALCLGGLPPLLLIAGSIVHPLYRSYYVYGSLIGVALSVGAVSGRLGWRFGFAPASAILLLGVFTAATPVGSPDSGYRDASQYAQAHSGSAAAILFDPVWLTSGLDYYATSPGFRSLLEQANQGEPVGLMWADEDPSGSSSPASSVVAVAQGTRTTGIPRNCRPGWIVTSIGTQARAQLLADMNCLEVTTENFRGITVLRVIPAS